MHAFRTAVFDQEPAVDQAPLLELLAEVFPARGLVLEIGSGLGHQARQLAVHFPQFNWLPTDQPRFLALLRQSCGAGAPSNLLPPQALDVTQPWPPIQADAVFSANTAHVMAWPVLEAMFAGVARSLPRGGRFCLLGPFRRGDSYLSGAHRQFDAMLRNRGPGAALKDQAQVEALAAAQGLVPLRGLCLPDRSLALVWERSWDARAPRQGVARY